MAKIPFLHGNPRADGTVAWHWKPSPRLRKAGWTNHYLGDGPGAGRGKPRAPDAVLTKANELNAKLEAWDLGVARVAEAKPIPRKYLFSDLVAAYRLSDEYLKDIEDATRREYDSRIRQLTYWAKDGALPIRAIDGDMVRDLKKALLAAGADGTPGSPFKCAAMMRVLRMLLRWAVAAKLLASDPTEGVAIPTPPSRTAMFTWRDVQDMTALASATPAGDPLSNFQIQENALAARALAVAFWTMQRRADLAQLNRFQWRELHGADPRDLPALVNAKGQVWGFRLQQQKTGRWVDCPLPAFLHDEIERAFLSSQWLFPHSQDNTKPISGDVLRRRVKPLLEAAGFPTHQLRDTRRSGMSWVKDMGAEKSDVFAISGHPLDGQKRTMADVYMPPNTKAACRAIAAAVRTMQAMAQREKENG